ncbi:MAG: magnesium-translocating P-type ATPase, partial [Betaproteobacteria bacterium]|nr:magnesium-translocating P-type ATPase [Betaproteobacteria bacterium]
MSDLSHARSDELLALARLPMSDLLAQLSTRPEGLSAAEAASALQRFGTNTLALSRRTHPAWQLLRMLVSPLSLLLMALATASWLTGEARGAVVIVAMVVLSTLLSFVQERRSSQAAEKLKALVSTRIRVQRDGRDEDLDVALVVPGDVVHLAVGDIIPADLRLLDGKDLFVNEASLSGESLPADKHPAVPDASADSAFDLKNLCFMGSHVVSGTAHGVVLRTGAATFFGHIADETTRQRKKTAFDLGLERFTGLMIRFMAVMVPAVFIINGMVKGDWFEAALFAIAVAVGLTPEMLPMLATINLAKGALAMSRRKVIVKRLTAVQNMGAMDVLCTDKTGTLTQDSVILERHVDVTGQTDPLVLEYAYLNSHYQSGLRNLLDVAVLQHVEVHERLHDADTYTRVDEIPFDFERRRMSVVLERVPAAKHAADDSERSHILICKGAVEEVIACCRVARVSGAEVPLDDARRQQIDSVVAQLNNDGFRVIAVAIREEPAAPHEYSVADETGLTLLGYVAFLDPPKESAGPAIAASRGPAAR